MQNLVNKIKQHRFLLLTILAFVLSLPLGSLSLFYFIPYLVFKVLKPKGVFADILRVFAILIYLLPATFFIFVLLISNGIKPTIDFNDPYIFFFSAVVSLVPLLIFGWYRIFKTRKETIRDIGLGREKILQGTLLGLLVAVILNVGLNILDYLFQLVGIRNSGVEILPKLSTLDPRLILVAVPVIVFAPISEEILFRAYYFRVYLEQGKKLIAYILPAFVWSSLHLSLYNFIPIFVFGLLLSFAYKKYNNFYIPLFAHLVNNSWAFFVFYYLPG